jgi:PucR C-terminal helix-turn-helix domain/GGDEF-like domain
MAVAAPLASTQSAVRETAEDLLPSTPELGRGMAEYISSAIPEIREIEDDELRAELRASTEANIAQVLRMLAHGARVEDITVPHEALNYLRGIVRRGLPLAVLLRSYRLGHAWLWEHWWEALNERVDDADELAAGQDESSSFMFAYVDRISGALVEEFGTERERMLRSAQQLRADTVRAILAGDPIDTEVASRRLGYELRRHHVAMRVSSGGSELEGLERAVGEAAAKLAGGEPLMIASGAARFDVWCGSFDRLATEALESYEPPPGVLVAFGRPGEGVAGFSSSHEEAKQAARIGALVGDTKASVTSYARVEFVSLLASDLARARAFVASQLGPLGIIGGTTERLRETVLAFLVSGGSPTRVAEELFVHKNTVTERIKRAEAILGHQVNERPVELEAALTLAARLGQAVLEDADGAARPERDRLRAAPSS